MLKVRNFYFENRPIDNQTLLEFSHLTSDTIYNYGVDKAVQIHSKSSTGKTYYYK